MEDLVLHEQHGAVALLRLNGPKGINALNDALMDALGERLLAAEADPNTVVVVLTGSERAFAAGADIARMKDLGYAEAFAGNFVTRNWEVMDRLRKPVVGAVRGFALGGGCELAMMCDTLVAGESAQFGQPEVKLGVPPGAGGTQRLPRAVGKAKAMAWCLTGEFFGAHEAERSGLVAKVVPDAEVVDAAMAMAGQMAQQSPLALMQIKELVKAAYEMPLAAGMQLERRAFHAAFATQDQKEGMAAFLEKRSPTFRGR